MEINIKVQQQTSAEDSRKSAVFFLLLMCHQCVLMIAINRLMKQKHTTMINSI